MRPPTRQRVSPAVRGRALPLPGRLAIAAAAIAFAALVVGFQVGRATAPPEPPAPPTAEAKASFPTPSPLPTPSPSLVTAASVAPALVEAYNGTSGPGWAICQLIDQLRCTRVRVYPLPAGGIDVLTPQGWSDLHPAVITGGHLFAVADACAVPMAFRLVFLTPSPGNEDLRIEASAVSNGCVIYLDLTRLSPGRYALLGQGIESQGSVTSAVGFSVVVPIH